MQDRPKMVEPTYSYARVLELAGEPDADGWRVVEVTLARDETAVNPASTKRVIYGPAKVRYEIHPSGVTAWVIA